MWEMRKIERKNNHGETGNVDVYPPSKSCIDFDIELPSFEFNFGGKVVGYCELCFGSFLSYCNSPFLLSEILAQQRGGETESKALPALTYC